MSRRMRTSIFGEPQVGSLLHSAGCADLRLRGLMCSPLERGGNSMLTLPPRCDKRAVDLPNIGPMFDKLQSLGLRGEYHHESKA